jgi:FkbM family methyltransferase
MPAALLTYVRLLQKGQAWLARRLPDSRLASIPGALRARSGVRRFLRRHLVPHRMEWVQIQSGFGEGLWLRIDLGSERNWWLGKHEPEVQAELQHLLSPNVVIYDIGAHIGFYALPAARQGAHVIAFEPDPESAARLRVHAKRNEVESSLRIIEAAVWSDADPKVVFRRGLPRSQGGVCSGEHRPVLASAEKIAVPAWSLDAFVGSGEPAPHIVKIDVEGGESEVLRGASDVLRIHKPALLVEVHTAPEHASVSDILQSVGYTTRWAIPAEGFPRQCFASPQGDPPLHRRQIVFHSSH